MTAFSGAGAASEEAASAEAASAEAASDDAAASAEADASEDAAASDDAASEEALAALPEPLEHAVRHKANSAAKTIANSALVLLDFSMVPLPSLTPKEMPKRRDPSADTTAIAYFITFRNDSSLRRTHANKTMGRAPDQTCAPAHHAPIYPIFPNGDKERDHCEGFGCAAHETSSIFSIRGQNSLGKKVRPTSELLPRNETRLRMSLPVLMPWRDTAQVQAGAAGYPPSVWECARGGAVFPHTCGVFGHGLFMSHAPGARLISKAGARWARDRRFCSAAKQREAKPARALPGARGGTAANLPNESCPRGETHLARHLG